MKNVVAYCRVSTSDQSVDMQRQDIENYCRARGLRLDREFMDQGISGARASRPALDTLMVEVRLRKIQTVLVWSLSRLGRSLKHLLSILEEFDSCGVTLVSLKEGWDLGTPTGRMIFQIMGALAEWEREQIRDRVKSGLKAARARGSRLGRPTINYDPERIMELKGAGFSTRAIAKEIGVSNATVSRTLSNLLQNPPKKIAVNA